MHKNKVNQYRNNFLKNQSTPGIMAELYQNFTQLLSASHKNLQDKDFVNYAENTQNLINLTYRARAVLTTPSSLDSKQTQQDIYNLFSYFQFLSTSLHHYLNSRSEDEYNKLLNHFNEMRDYFLSAPTQGLPITNVPEATNNGGASIPSSI